MEQHKHHKQHDEIAIPEGYKLVRDKKPPSQKKKGSRRDNKPRPANPEPHARPVYQRAPFPVYHEEEEKHEEKKYPYQEAMENMETNPLHGQGPVEVAKKLPQARKIVSNVNKWMKNEYPTVDPVKSEYAYALSKLQKHLATTLEDENLGRLKISDFAAVIACDDLLTTAIGVGSTLYDLYQKPEVKAFVNGLISKGYSSVRSWFTGAKPNADSRETNPTTSHTAADAVNIEHVFCALTETNSVASDPADIPKAVYTARATSQFSLIPNTSGSVALILTGAAFYDAQSLPNQSFMSVNNSTLYNPSTTTATGTYVDAPGPLGSSQTQFAAAKIIGFEIEVQPFASLNQSEGGYVAGFFTDQISTAGTGSTMTTNILTFQNLSEIPYFRVCDMKTTTYHRMYPTTDRSIQEWYPANASVGVPRPDYSSFALIVKGADPSATISVRYTLVYSVLPQKSVQNLIRGQIPVMGPYTDFFLEYLRTRFPDIVYWHPKKVLELYRVLTSMRTDSYTALAKFDFTYAEPYNEHRGVSRDSRGPGRGMFEVE